MKKVLIMLAALPLLAASAVNGSFSGQVFDGEGSRHIGEAIVTVSTPSGYVASVVTNKEGEFSFNTLPQGEYSFRVTAHGYAIYEREITAGGETGVKGLVVRLLVPADKQTVSVRELKNPVTSSVWRGL
jgi:hypothetical protein